ncbi:MAG: ParA family protein [Planctomycetes bacterium]|nr:ParA family protein [Planctomycetota bacterium]MCB9905124.1 ParA family protein [Planctomycetota bacterium]
MRRIAIINQKGGVGKTTTSANLGAALAEQGRRVVVVDMDPQANASLHLGIEAASHEPSVYSLLTGELGFAASMRETKAPRLSVVPSNIDLSGAELELASAIGRDSLVRDAIEDWSAKHRAEHGEDPADYVIFDCPPSLGLLSINALAAAGEVLITVQTQFLALMGMSKLVEVVQLIRRRLNPELTITGIVPCLYDSRLKLNREVLGEIRKYFPGQVFKNAIRSNVKLAEAPSFGVSILDYASESNGAQDYRLLALEVIEQESRDSTLAHLSPARPIEELAKERGAQQAAVCEQEFSDRDVALQTDADEPAEEDTLVEAEAPAAAHVETVEEAVESAEPQPTEPEAVLEAEAAEPEVELREHVLEPAAPPAVEPAPRAAEPKRDDARPTPPSNAPAPFRRVGAVEDELRILRADDLPQLPPEAFEIPR